MLMVEGRPVDPAVRPAGVPDLREQVMKGRLRPDARGHDLEQQLWTIGRHGSAG